MTDNANNDPLSSALGMVPLEKNNAVQKIIAEAHDDSATTDFEIARQNIHQIIENGMTTLSSMANLVDQAQSARLYEVYSTLMKTVVDANKDLMELQKKIRDVKDADRPIGSEAKSVTNNLFVGSTAELQKAIENLRNGNG